MKEEDKEPLTFWLVIKIILFNALIITALITYDWGNLFDDIGDLFLIILGIIGIPGIILIFINISK